MRHSGEVAPFESQLSTRAYTERIRNDKSASRRSPPRLTFSYDISLKPVSGQRSFNAAVNKRLLFESCESSDVII